MQLYQKIVGLFFAVISDPNRGNSSKLDQYLTKKPDECKEHQGALEKIERKKRRDGESEYNWVKQNRENLKQVAYLQSEGTGYYLQKF